MAQLLQKLQHVLPAAPLLFQGISRLQHEPHGWSLLLAAGEVGISVLVVGAFIRTVRAARRTHDADHGDGHASHGVDWVDLLIGAMLGGMEYWVREGFPVATEHGTTAGPVDPLTAPCGC